MAVNHPLTWFAWMTMDSSARTVSMPASKLGTDKVPRDLTAAADRVRRIDHDAVTDPLGARHEESLTRFPERRLRRAGDAATP